MPNHSPSYAKNAIRRALRALTDPEPTASQKSQIWDFFGRECAYCGRILVRKDREGHIDHLVARSAGGTNHVSNRVLACHTCNSDEKLDSDWEVFLRAKNPDKDSFDQRFNLIQQWTMNIGNPPPQDVAFVEFQIEKVLTVFDDSVERIRRSIN